MEFYDDISTSTFIGCGCEGDDGDLVPDESNNWCIDGPSSDDD